MHKRAGDLRTRLVHMGAVTLVGGAFGFLLYVSEETAWRAALVLGVVTYLTGLADGLGPGTFANTGAAERRLVRA